MTGVQTCALRSEEHTSELQSHDNLVCRLLLEKKEHLSPRNKRRTAKRPPARPATLPPPAHTPPPCPAPGAVPGSGFRKVATAFFIFLNARRPPNTSAFPRPASSTT